MDLGSASAHDAPPRAARAVGAMFFAGFGAVWLLRPAVILIVGLHFLPLGRLFRHPPHYLTGGALIVLAASYPFVANVGPESAIGAPGIGVVLWASAAFAISPVAPRASGRMV